MDVVEKLASENLLTEEQVERIGRNVAEVVKAAQKDPSLMKEALEKMAIPAPAAAAASAASKAPAGFFGTAMRHAKEYAPWALGSAVVGGGMTLGSRGAQMAFTGVKDHLQKSRAYKEMLETNPELQQANPELVQKGFNTLYRFNPQFARDPLVSSTFVKNIVDQERLNLADVKALVDARRSLAPPPGVDFFSMPKADIASSMHASSFDPDTSAGEEAKGQLSGTKQETADYEKTRSKYRAEEAYARKEEAEKRRQAARAQAAAANVEWARKMGL